MKKLLKLFVGFMLVFAVMAPSVQAYYRTYDSYAHRHYRHYQQDRDYYPWHSGVTAAVYYDDYRTDDYYVTVDVPFRRHDWVELRHEGKRCYGKAVPYAYAGMGVSYDLADCLRMRDWDEVDWRFVAKKEMLDGPWWQKKWRY